MHREIGPHRRVQKALAQELKLGVPPTTWHVARDAFAEPVNLLALVTGSLGEIATYIVITASNEFGEVYDFLALIKAGVAPLVFLTIVHGIASAGDLKSAGRVGWRSIVYFEVVSTRRSCGADYRRRSGVVWSRFSALATSRPALTKRHPTR